MNIAKAKIAEGRHRFETLMRVVEAGNVGGAFSTSSEQKLGGTTSRSSAFFSSAKSVHGWNCSNEDQGFAIGQLSRFDLERELVASEAVFQLVTIMERLVDEVDAAICILNAGLSPARLWSYADTLRSDVIEPYRALSIVDAPRLASDPFGMVSCIYRSSVESRYAALRRARVRLMSSAESLAEWELVRRCASSVDPSPRMPEHLACQPFEFPVEDEQAERFALLVDLQVFDS